MRTTYYEVLLTKASQYAFNFILIEPFSSLKDTNKE